MPKRRPEFVKFLPRALAWMIKFDLNALVMARMLLYNMCRHGRPLFVLVQSPPALPVLPVLCMLRQVTGLKVVLDVHNLAYTLMRPQKGSSQAGRMPRDGVVASSCTHFRHVARLLCHACKAPCALNVAVLA
jgi:hypothetical protein